MSAIEKLEQRLAVVEAELKKIKANNGTLEKPWWENWFGAFENDPIFEEAMKLGREWRNGDKPKSKKKKEQEMIILDTDILTLIEWQDRAGTAEIARQVCRIPIWRGAGMHHQRR